MDNIIDIHRSIFQEMEIKANSGVSNMMEFAKVLEDKMECARASARVNK